MRAVTPRTVSVLVLACGAVAIVSMTDWLDPNWRHQLSNTVIGTIAVGILATMAGFTWAVFNRLPHSLAVLVGAGAVVGAAVGGVAWLVMGRMEAPSQNGQTAQGRIMSIKWVDPWPDGIPTVLITNDSRDTIARKTIRMTRLQQWHVGRRRFEDSAFATNATYAGRPFLEHLILDNHLEMFPGESVKVPLFARLSSGSLVFVEAMAMPGTPSKAFAQPMIFSTDGEWQIELAITVYPPWSTKPKEPEIQTVCLKTSRVAPPIPVTCR